ncbi:hypothetical protein MAMC_01278 [Methylacidimicrobium cyclopophantes]|uniref:CRISPR type III-associated protein domain-containing protein n=1 Tax=Methylacidimicrobium cyclopophantes TaxID=1041766 RepID=A0A5E6MC72_9BACT|nr:type III-B CRISPR module RAMP protein Cmr1 [Methylacidimicrobium cyclopophantes]VVM06819.1 hypothetical protein MAMC_01278 [Methylacidimicrobium cyclopophantes]
MNVKSYEFEFLTPCFCGGAEPTKAELRVPAIRGQLRWWFRALGGSRTDEEEVFGCAGNSSAASKVVVRVERQPEGGERGWDRESHDGDYLWYFIKRGDRWKEEGALPPGSKAGVEIGFRQPLGKLEENWKKAWEAFCRFGSLGYRATRCAGAFRVDGFAGVLEAYEEAAERILKPAGFDFHFFREKQSDWRNLIAFAGAKLKELREKYPSPESKKEEKGPSPLGNTDPRQKSAVYFRPLKIDAGDYYLMLFEAPHKRVVEEKSRLKNGQESILKMVFPRR